MLAVPEQLRNPGPEHPLLAEHRQQFEDAVNRLPMLPYGCEYTLTVEDSRAAAGDLVTRCTWTPGPAELRPGCED